MHTVREHKEKSSTFPPNSHFFCDSLSGIFPSLKCGARQRRRQAPFRRSIAQSRVKASTSGVVNASIVLDLSRTRRAASMNALSTSRALIGYLIPFCQLYRKNLLVGLGGIGGRK